MYNFECAATTKTGRRSNNQDNFTVGRQYAPLVHDLMHGTISGNTDRPFLAAVADGMGGEASGERASFEAARVLSAASHKLTSDFNANKAIVRQEILNANATICNAIAAERTERMGSTVVSVLIQDDTLFYTNLGDSRLYMLRDGVLHQLTHDHTEGQTMVDAGVLTAEQLKRHSSRNKLNRYLGIFSHELQLDVPVYNDIQIKTGDVFLLLSDGVFGALPLDEIANMSLQKVEIQQRAAQMVDAAYAAGSRDNMTAVLIEIGTRHAGDSVNRILMVSIPLVVAAIAVALSMLLLGSNRNKPADTVPAPTPTFFTQSSAPTADTVPTKAPVFPSANTATPIPTPVTTPVPTRAPTPTPSTTPTPTPSVTPSYSPSPTSAPATFTPDPIVTFHNPAFEQAFREGYDYDGIIYMSDILGFTELNLDECELTDIQDVAKFENMITLVLNNNRISSFTPLYGLKALKDLHLKNTGITAEQLAALRNELPSTTIIAY